VLSPRKNHVEQEVEDGCLERRVAAPGMAHRVHNRFSIAPRRTVLVDVRAVNRQTCDELNEGLPQAVERKVP
jgi:hypothetical protein